MKIKEILKEMKGVFIPPIKKYYLGWIRYGTPYFDPWGFNSTIIKIRKLKRRTKEEYDEYIEKYSHKKNSLDAIYKNVPMVKRIKYFIIKNFYITIGSPIKIAKVHLGWKDKFESPRFEWSPSFIIFFFKWQFVIIWTAPCKNSDAYWEQFLWWLKYSNKDMEKAKRTWGWKNDKGESSWSDNYLIK